MLFATAALAARPVAGARHPGPDDVSISRNAAGVVVQFEVVRKADAQAALDEVARQLALEGALRVGFFKTAQGPLAAVYLPATRSLTLKQLKELAAATSKMPGTRSATAFVHPWPGAEPLDFEAWWRFEAGVETAQRRLGFREDADWILLQRRKISAAQLAQKQWPGWPLSELCVALGLPGRDFLERPQGLLDLSSWEAPRDVGANQALTLAYLPDATVLEIRQLAEAQKASPSRLVEDALLATDKASKLGESPDAVELAPWDEEAPGVTKAPLRELPLFLSRPVWERLQVKTSDDAVSDSHLIEAAWRIQHPYSKKKPAP